MADEEYHKKNPEIKPDWKAAHVFGNDDSAELPVQQVSWYHAVMFCNWLSWKLELDSCYEIKKSEPKAGQRNEHYEVSWLRQANGIRLPSESEWEYVCRAATTTRFSFGEDDSNLKDYGWFVVNSNRRTHPGRKKLCNALGLFDTHGNVWEWCWDRDKYDSRGSYRVPRGGGWRRIARRCRSSFRCGHVPASRGGNLGFRVARGPSSQASKSSK